MQTTCRNPQQLFNVSKLCICIDSGYTTFHAEALRALGARLLIVQCSQFAFVCMYVCMYIYIYICPSHFNCVGAVSVVLSPDY